MELFGLLLVLGLIASLILPWVNLARISSTRSELERLRQEVRGLQDRRDAAAVKPMVAEKKTPEAAEAPAPKPVDGARRESGDPGSATLLRGTASEQPKPVAVEKPQQVAVKKAVVGADAEMVRSASRPVMSQSSESDPGNATLRSCSTSELVERKEASAEPQDWFSKIAVWVGGIALLMAGFYMIKYSIDSGWLTSAVRLWLTTGFGALLCGAGFVIGIKSAMAANERIGQALSGAGIACLYFAAYAAVHLYGFLSPGQGFVAMLVVTVLAVALSLKNGAPIAMMGLVGGFLTPWLMSTGSQDTVMLFSYLFLLFCGAQFLCVQRGWWALLLGSLVGAYLWSAAVIIGNLSGTLDNLQGTLLFVMGICFVNAVWVFLAKRDSLDATSKRLLVGIRMLTWGGGLVQGLVLVLIGGFAAVDMALFSLLSVGALVLAVLREEEFIWTSWLALTAVGAAVLSNTDVSIWSWLITPLGLMGLFFVVGHWRGLSSERRLSWRSVSVAAALLVVPLLYLNREWIVGFGLPMDPALWLGLAVLWAGLLALAGEHVFRREGNREVAGEYSAFAVFLLGFGLWVYVPEAFHAHAAAVVGILSALYWKWRSFGRSALVVSAFGAAWAVLMYHYAEGAGGYFFTPDVFSGLEQDGLSILSWGLGLAGAATALACFRQVWTTGAIRGLSWGLGIVGLMGFVASYHWLDANHMPTQWSAETVDGGMTALLAVASVGFVYLARKWASLQWASAVAAALCGIRVVMLHIGGSGAAGESFFLNALLLQFGVPFMAGSILAWEQGEAGDERLRRICQLSAMLLGFVWATFLVQDYYGGSELWGGTTSSGELYTYSVVWLLLAVAYQAIGLWRDQAAIHVGSLILLLVTIGKVFLVDASELEGLFRVLSFLGLGLALIGIGFFYNKVVFARRERADQGESQNI